MTYSQRLRRQFPDISLQWEDLLLLESFQIAYLPDRVAEKEFATLVRTYPVVYRFLISKHPPIHSFLARILEENRSPEAKETIEAQNQEALWEIADLIIFNKYPEQFNARSPIRWEISEISAITSLEGKVVADVGAGTGRIAFLAAPLVRIVYAVEPVSRFRSYMKEKAVSERVKNLFVMDGTLDSIPLPENSLDMLITSNAIGWKLDEELLEIERVVRPGGHAIHLLQSNEQAENPHHGTLTSPPGATPACRIRKHINRGIIKICNSDYDEAGLHLP
ncbi:MAG: class I SAM-dependent methyltransferase [Bacteroidales bacterium]|nr:class I SAM-dependent methyltransferase [Bacteroidales bacterium]